PIQYGRARKALGLPPLSTRGEPRNITSGPAWTPSTAAADASADEAGDDPADTGDATPAPAAPDVVAPRRKGSPAFDFLVQELRADASLVYGVLRERAEAKGLKIAPIMYGRAKAVLGLVPVKPRGQGRKAIATAAAAANAPPRTLKQVESVAADRFHQELENVRNLEQLVNTVKELDADRRRMRDLLERIVMMIDEALG
ncbi:MAG: hypothetical protein WAT39_26255, partial [Planctomycetota bacterium]